MERRSLPDKARHRDRAAHSFGQTLDNGQPQTAALFFLRAISAGLDERLENRVEVLLRNARAGVLDIEKQSDVTAALLLLPTDPDVNPPLVRELHGVAHQIDQNLAEADPVEQQ